MRFLFSSLSHYLIVLEVCMTRFSNINQVDFYGKTFESSPTRVKKKTRNLE